MKRTNYLNLRALCFGVAAYSASALFAFTGTTPPGPSLSWSISDYNGQMISCAGANDASIDLTITDGLAPFTIQWSGLGGFNSTDEDLSALSPGQYDISISDANGDVVGASIQIDPTSAVQIIASISNKNGYGVSCNGGSDGEIDISTSGGTGPYTYEWSDASGLVSTGQDLVNFPAGSYTLVVTDANLCQVSGTYALTEAAPNQTNITISTYIGGYHVSCSDAQDGKVDLSPSGGVSPHYFNWDGPNGYNDTNPHINGIDAGQYILSMSDANGCLVHDTIELIAPDPMVVNLTGPFMVNGHHFICAGQTNGNIDAAVTGGTPFYNYTWSGPAGSSFSSQDLSGVGAGAYNLIVNDTNSCNAAASITLTEPDSIAVSAVISDFSGDAVSCNGSDGAIDITVSGGAGAYSYYWINSNAVTYTSEDLSGLEAGTYSLNIADASNCTYSVDYVLTQTPAIEASFSVSNSNGFSISCFGENDGSIDLSLNNASAPYIVNWSGPSGYTSNSEDINSLAPGQYTLNVVDAKSCTFDTTLTLTEPAAFTTSLSAPETSGYHISCNGGNNGSITATVNGGELPITSTWSGPNGFSSSDLSISGLEAGSYTLTSIDANSCQSTETVVLQDPSSLIAASTTTSTTSSGHEVSCADGADGSINLSITGGLGPYTTTWTLPDGSTDSNEDMAGLSIGSYTVLIEDALGCTHVETLSLSAPTAITVTAISTSQYAGGSAVSCISSTDGSITVSFAGGISPYTLSWTGPNGFTSTANSPTGLGAGMYYFLLTDDNGCTLNDSIELSAPSIIDANLSASTFVGGANISCNGLDDGTLTTSPTGGASGYTYSWSGPGGFTATSASISDLAPGNYCVEISDANSCTNTECFTLVEPNEIDLSSTSSTAFCGTSIGGIDLSILGGTAPYSFSWSNGSSDQDLSNAPPGTYSVSVSDANGCTAIHTAIVSGTTAITAIGTVYDASCATGSDGAIDLSVLSGAPPYSFTWSNGENSQDISGLSAGNYSVIITDSQGCEAIVDLVVDEPAPLFIDLLLSDHNGFNVSHFNAADGEASANISGGTSPYTINWSTGDNGTAISNLIAGSYLISITDAHGCYATQGFDIEQPYDLAMPNGFSPNGDGYNDAFIVQGIELYPNNEITIMNRWGDVVFSRSNYQNDWTGRNNKGQDLKDGTYFVLFLAADAEIELTSYVELRR